MKRLLSIAFFTAVSAAALLPQPAAAHNRVHVTMTDHEPVRAYERQYHPHDGYAPSARSTRDWRYDEPRHWVDRNHDGMNDRRGYRGRRDLDRDGIWDRYDRDLDNDGIANRYDRDMDGDGVRNRRDRRPDNRYVY